MHILVSLLVSVSATSVVYALWRLFHPYVKRGPLDHIPGPPPKSSFTGNLPDFNNRQGWKFWKHLADTYGPVCTITGLLRRRALLVHDPKAMHTVLIKDMEFWPKELSPSDLFTALLGPGVLTARGGQHRRQRKLLNPIFSVSHLRSMPHIFYGVAHKVRTAIKTRLPADGTAEELDVNGWMARTTLEMLGQAGLGYSFDNFADDSTDAYGDSVKRFFPTMSRTTLFGVALELGSYVVPEWLILAVFRHCPLLPDTRELIKISDTMRRRSQEIIDERKHALRKGDGGLLQTIGEGKDIMSICLKANMAASETEKLNDEELLSQMSTFILAGMDTTSNALSRILNLLAEHPSVQQKLRAELVEARGGSPEGGDSDLAYDDLMKLPYLDAVCRETLRVYAPVTLSGRVASKDMVLPLSSPVRAEDGSMVHQIAVPRKVVVLVHYQASNTNPELWGEDAHEWKPERWLAPLPPLVEEARIPGVYSSLMTFSGGSHSCIGFKFAELETKVVLSALIPAFSFELTEKPIAWNSSAVNYPTMGEESDRPEMLLKVAAV